MADIIDKLEDMSQETQIILNLLDYTLDDMGNRDFAYNNWNRITSILIILNERVCLLDEMQRALIEELLQKMPQQSGNSSKGTQQKTHFNCKV